jgi:polyhydroxyalkanoate synthesis regulator phasin
MNEVNKMKELVKKGFLLGLGAASMTKTQAENAMKELVKKNALTVQQGKELLNKARNVALYEKKRLSDIASKEAARIASKLMDSSRPKIVVLKKKAKTLEKELSARGKKTLRSILKSM